MALSPEAMIPTNRILSGLPLDQADRLRSHLKVTTANLHDVLYRPGDPMQYVYLPLEPAVISLQASTQDGRSVEVAMIGSEGMVGVHAILGAKVTTRRAIVHVPGSLMRIEAETLKSEFARGGVLQDRILACIRQLLMDVSQSAACNRVHHLKQRLCRWLLGMHTRARRDQLPVTHEILAQALGTPRSEVTLAAGALRQAGMIEYTRGCIIIRDRLRLDQAACECYRAVNRNDVLSTSAPASDGVTRSPLTVPMPMGTDSQAARTAALRRPHLIHRGL